MDCSEVVRSPSSISDPRITPLCWGPSVLPCREINTSSAHCCFRFYIGVTLGHDFLRPSDISHLKKKAVFGLLPPAAFFPFNIPLAPIWSPPDSEERQLLLQSSLLDNTSTSAPSVRLRQQACDVCRGTLVGAGCCAIEKTDGDDDEFDAADGGGTQQPSKTTSLVVPLPRVYAAAVKKRAAAYENWHKLVQVSYFSEGFSGCGRVPSKSAYHERSRDYFHKRPCYRRCR